MSVVGKALLRTILALGGVALVTVAGKLLVTVNATTVGFVYLLLVLVIATAWGFIEAATASIAATVAFNFFFLPPVGTLTIADPQNWVALASFLATALIASRLSDTAKRRTLDAIGRRQDIERLYTFSRSILLIEGGDPFGKQLAAKLAEIFELSAVVLYERRTDETWHAGPHDFEGLEEQLRDAALNGTFFHDPERQHVITAVRLGSEPVAALAVQGPPMADSVLQGIANLAAIGLERAHAQDLAHQVEAARQTEQLRTTLIDGMAHEFKTPLTSIKAATTSLLADPDQPAAARHELLEIADEEADHLRGLIDNAIEMARLDISHIELHTEPTDLVELVREAVRSLRRAIDNRTVDISGDTGSCAIACDPRMVKLAVKQLVDNAVKYSPPTTPVEIRVHAGDAQVSIAVTDHGPGIPHAEQARVFERYYRGTRTRGRVPGSGLGLNIASSIVRAHNGDLSVTSKPGETTFRLTLPVSSEGASHS